MTEKKDIHTRQRTIKEQRQLDSLATGLSMLFGAQVVPKEHFDKVNQEKEKLLRQTKDLENTRNYLIKYYCRFLAFQAYHSNWKPTTRKIEKRTQTLIDEQLLIKFDKISNDIKENLEEAYKCFIHGQEIACYVMLLRTVEITINHIYDPIKNPNKDHIPAKQKLDWINKNGHLSGADYFIMKGFIEGRNEAIHTVFRPTEKQLFSAFETVIKLIKKLLDSKPAPNIGLP